MAPTTSRWSIAWLVVAQVSMTVTGCVAVPPSAFTRADSGPEPAPIDQAIVDDRIARFTLVADRLGDERCRCAGDYDTCRLELDADWDSAGRACLAEVVREDLEGVTNAIACLEQDIGTFEICHSAYACVEASARQACLDTWKEAGSTCLMSMNPSAQVLFATCKAVTPDGGI